jgi:hypothetical protein
MSNNSDRMGLLSVDVGSGTHWRIPVVILARKERWGSERLQVAPVDRADPRCSDPVWVDASRVTMGSLASSSPEPSAAASSIAGDDDERPDRSCDPDCARRFHPFSPCTCSRSEPRARQGLGRLPT